MREILLSTALVIAAAGCAPRDAEIRMQRLAAERRNLEETLDRLEERLVADQARVRFWTEMKARHESVTAIACAGLDQHAEAMAERILPPPRTASRDRLDGARVAALRPALASEPAPPPPPAAPPSGD